MVSANRSHGSAGIRSVGGRASVRGLLWGYLRDRDWPENCVFVTVAALFWLAHFYYRGEFPISFWVVVPLGSTVLTYLAWRSRSIGTTMIAHALTNAIGDLVSHFRWIL